jgi:hypothetical protein
MVVTLGEYMCWLKNVSLFTRQLGFGDLSSRPKSGIESIRYLLADSRTRERGRDDHAFVNQYDEALIEILAKNRRHD